MNRKHQVGQVETGSVERFQQQGKQVMLAAGDPFRAAAVEQLQVWGERNDIPVVAQQTGADSASVLRSVSAIGLRPHCPSVLKK